MANIVELRELDEAKLEEMLEDAREALFKLRFRDASCTVRRLFADQGDSA